MGNYAKIEDGVCINAAVFKDSKTAIDLGYPIQLPDGYGIGDLYDGESWSHAPAPEPEPEPEPEPVEVARAAKVAEISAACNAAIDAGTSVDLPSGTREAFTYTVADQANISEMFTACLAGATGYIYHENNGPCKNYPAADVVAIYGTLSMYKTGQLTYHNQLRQFVNSLTTAEDIRTVTYGQPLIGEYLTQYNALMAEAQTQMDAVLAKISQGMSV